MTATLTNRSNGYFTPERLATWSLVIFTELLLVAGYLALSPTTVEKIRYVIYPFVWINVGLLAVLSVHPKAGNRKHAIFGASIAIGYFVLLLYFASNLGGNPLTVDWSARISMATPGWGPIFIAKGPGFRFYLVPFEVIGYGALSYLLYANVLQLSRSLLSGALGLVTCVGCTVPILAPFVGLLGGPATSLTTVAYQYSYDLGTLLFVITVGLLYTAASGRRLKDILPVAGRR